MASNDLSVCIRKFLMEHLTVNRGLSRHTILSYRDTVKLLLKFTADYVSKPVTNIGFNDLTADVIGAFLESIEKERCNSIGTRNVRLACIHSFINFAASREPLACEHYQRILTIPFKRVQAIQTVDYLEREEMKAVLEIIDRKTVFGQRDHTLLMLMYNTGARVQEVVDLNVPSLQLERPYHVRFFGKGAKERVCPLWPDTVVQLKALLKNRQIDSTTDVPVFVNRQGQRLTRFGVRYLLAKYITLAKEQCTSLKRKRRIHPHTIRHTTAMHLVQAGVDINTIRA
jgi:site-specific recombinase XerD